MRGTGQAIAEWGKEIMKDFLPDILRVIPTYSVSMGIHDDIVQPNDVHAPARIYHLQGNEVTPAYTRRAWARTVAT